ncbi:hypothetical protein REPUB_Repub13aG0257900 [Reevesia pubescens]
MSSLTRIFRRTFSTTQTSKPCSVRKLVADLYQERNLERLVQKFKTSCENDYFRSRSEVYRDMVRRLASAGRYECVEEILEHQKKYKNISTEGFCVRLIHLYGKSGMFEQAYKVFGEMPHRGLLSFNALMEACVNTKNFDEVIGFFKEFSEKLSIEPDLVSYNTVIKAFCETGSLDSALLMLFEMEKKGVEPNVITINTLLNGFFKNRSVVDGKKICGKMEDQNVEPDTRSYYATLLGLVTEKKMEHAVNFVEEMRSKGVKVDVFTSNYMIRGFVNEGNLEEAKKWYIEIRKNRCAPDKLTFTMLVSLLCEKGDLSFAIEECKTIFLSKALVGDDALLQRVVDKLVETSMIEDAKELVELGKARYNLNMPAE